MGTHRRHSIEFKRQVVQEYLDGGTLHGLAKRHDIAAISFASGSASTRKGPSTRSRRPLT